MLDRNKVAITREMLAHPFVMNFYNVMYNEFAVCRMRYGQTIYDSEQGRMFFVSPGQPLKGIETATASKGFTLLIHPDFLRNYALDKRSELTDFLTIP